MGKESRPVLVFVVIGVVLLIAAFYSAQSTRSFLAGAEVTAGIVVDLNRRVSRDSDGNRDIMYFPVVEYSVHGRGQWQFTGSLGSNPPAYRQGQQVEVLYQRHDPSDARIKGFFSLWGFPLFLSAMGLLFTGFPALMYYGAYRRRQVAEWLRSSGKPVQATNAVSERTSNRVNGRDLYLIRAQWKNPATGLIHVFYSPHLRFNPDTCLPADKSVTVFIDADNPSRYWMDTRFLPDG